MSEVTTAPAPSAPVPEAAYANLSESELYLLVSKMNSLSELIEFLNKKRS